MPELEVGAVGSSSYSSVWLGFGIGFRFLQPLFCRRLLARKLGNKGDLGAFLPDFKGCGVFNLECLGMQFQD